MQHRNRVGKSPWVFIFFKSIFFLLSDVMTWSVNDLKPLHEIWTIASSQIVGELVEKSKRVTGKKFQRRKSNKKNENRNKSISNRPKNWPGAGMDPFPVNTMDHCMPFHCSGLEIRSYPLLRHPVCPQDIVSIEEDIIHEMNFEVERKEDVFFFFFHLCFYFTWAA